MTQSPPHERERERILQIIDRHYIEQDNGSVIGFRTREVLAAITKEISKEIKKQPWDEMWEPNYWDTPPEPISASLVEETEKQG